MKRQLEDVQNERDQLRGWLADAERARSAAEQARDELTARVTELERSVLDRHKQLREDAERCLLRLRQVKAVLTTYRGECDGFETDGELDVVDGVRCLVQTLHDKSAVCSFLLSFIASGAYAGGGGEVLPPNGCMIVHN